MTKNRYIAHIVIEADTPLKVGSNAMDFWLDSPVQRDWNGLPMILGSSITGVLRKEFDKKTADNIFGFQEGEAGEGSRVIISNALLLDEKGKVSEGLLLEKSDFLKIFDNLPIREHVAIDGKGVAANGAKFDEEVVYKGARFKFSIEFVEGDRDSFEAILNLLSNPALRLGGGSTKGFGKFKVCEIKTTFVDLENYSSSLNGTPIGCEEHKIDQAASENYTAYTLKIKPDDFFMFGSGFGDSDADMTPVYEQIVDYEKHKLTAKQILIPASSIKGALAHRTTYHFNLLNKFYVGNEKARNCVKEIFGEAKNSKKNIDGSKGKILISDCFKAFDDETKQTKTFDHVSIDRFTGGAIEGALFQEKTVADNSEYEIEILLQKDIDETTEKVFESALNDICIGMLPLGGSTTKGHGIFSGNWGKK